MNFSSFFLASLVTLLSLFQSSQGFALNGAATGASSFVVSSKATTKTMTTTTTGRTVTMPKARSTSSSTTRTFALLYMGSQAKFGIFSPAVYAAKIALGQDRLNKIRGKAISLHSEKIGQFCQFVGAGHLRTRVIKKAKVNGDTLGFLV